MAAGPALALALVATLAMAACGCDAGSPRPTGRPAGDAGSPGASSPGRARSRTASGALVFCHAPSLTFLAGALGRVMPGSGRSEVVPLGASAGGGTVYVSAWTPRFSGVAALDLGSGRLRPIMRFADPATDQADGTADGRWLVWAQTYSLASLDRFTIYSWNAVTGRRQRIGQSLAGPGGTPWASPWHAPAVSGNYAAWAQGYGPGGLVEIRLADLAAGTVTTVARGHVQAPFFDGGLLVWPESETPGSQTTLRAYSLAAGTMTRLPRVLATVHGTDFVVTDGTRTAYLSPDFTRLYYSPAQGQAGRPVLTLPAGADFTDLALAPDSLAWTTTSATYLASTRTGTFAQVTPAYGYPTGSGSVMLITDAPSEKAAHPPLPTHVIDPAAISWPACRSRSS